MNDMFADDIEAPRPPQGNEVEHPSYKYNTATLPSRGKFGYPETVEYRDILVKDEKIIATATPDNFQKVLNGVLKSLLKDGSFFDKLTIHDRDFLMTWIWANNYPTTRKLEYECSHCGTKNNTSFDILELDVTELDDEYEIPEYTLRNGETIKVKQLTVADEASMSQIAKTSDLEEWYIAQCMSIDLGRVMPLKQKINFIEENISGFDMAKIRGILNNTKYGVPTTLEATCASCGEGNVINIPFQVDFFLPVL